MVWSNLSCILLETTTLLQMPHLQSLEVKVSLTFSTSKNKKHNNQHFNFNLKQLIHDCNYNTGHKCSLDVASIVQGEKMLFSVLLLTWGIYA